VAALALALALLFGNAVPPPLLFVPLPLLGGDEPCAGGGVPVEDGVAAPPFFAGCTTNDNHNKDERWIGRRGMNGEQMGDAPPGAPGRSLELYVGDPLSYFELRGPAGGPRHPAKDSPRDLPVPHQAPSI